MSGCQILLPVNVKKKMTHFATIIPPPPPNKNPWYPLSQLVEEILEEMYAWCVKMLKVGFLSAFILKLSYIFFLLLALRITGKNNKVLR